MSEPVSIDAAFDRLEERWASRVVARINDDDVRIAKVEGDHALHAHPTTGDEHGDISHLRTSHGIELD